MKRVKSQARRDSAAEDFTQWGALIFTAMPWISSFPAYYYCFAVPPCQDEMFARSATRKRAVSTVMKRTTSTASIDDDEDDHDSDDEDDSGAASPAKGRESPLQRHNSLVLAKAVNGANVRDIIRKSSMADDGRRGSGSGDGGGAAGGAASPLSAAAAAQRVREKSIEVLVPGKTTRTERRRRATLTAKEQCKKRWRLLRNVRCLMTRGHREVQYSVQQGQATVEDSKTRVRRRKSLVRGKGPHNHTPAQDTVSLSLPFSF